MTEVNTIIWQKWIDPFGDESLDNEEDFDPYVGKYNDSEDLEDNQQLTYKDLPDEIKYRKSAIKVIATPMGIIPVNDNTMSSKLFNFWVGHTNFDITSLIANTIEQTDGVETLDIFTRYRFRISVGKAFDDSSVMRNINKRVYEELT